MTANRLPNHVTPTKRYFRLCPLLAPSQASGTKVCTFGTLCKSLAKNFQIFLHFYSKDGKLFKRFVFCYRENLILVGNVVQKVQKKAPDYPRPKKYNVGVGGLFLLFFTFSCNLKPFVVE